MLVVWMSSTGAEILFRIELAPFAEVLLRCGKPSLEFLISKLCLARRVVKALVMVDMLVVLGRLGEWC